MKIEDIISCLEEELNGSGKSSHLLVLHKSVSPAFVKAYSKYSYILYDIKNKEEKDVILHFLKVILNIKGQEENTKNLLEKEFLITLFNIIGNNYNNIKERNYEVIKV